VNKNLNHHIYNLASTTKLKEESEMSIATDNLIHFLGREYKDSPEMQFDIFRSIITDGLRTGKITIKFGQGGSIFNQLTCFTDIPLSECDEHTSIYGKFGIGFKKSFIKRCGGNPARYFVNYLPGQTLDEDLVENRGQLYMNLCMNFDIVLKLRQLHLADSNFTLFDVNGNEILSAEEIRNLIAAQMMMFSHDKEIGDIGPARDETKEMDLYYKEREWRLVPSALNIISSVAEFREGKYYYKFKRSDVNMILVPNQDIRSKVMDFLSSLTGNEQGRLEEFSKNKIPVLCYDDLRKW
jgi:hypothetical protein